MAGLVFRTLVILAALLGTVLLTELVSRWMRKGKELSPTCYDRYDHGVAWTILDGEYLMKEDHA